MVVVFFFFNDTATTEIYTLSLHDALPIFATGIGFLGVVLAVNAIALPLVFFVGFGVVIFLVANAYLLGREYFGLDRKSTRLNSSHANISYAVFCLKKKKNNTSPVADISYI